MAWLERSAIVSELSHFVMVKHGCRARLGTSGSGHESPWSTIRSGKRIAPSVSSFNVVVELGQIAFNTVLLSVIALVRRIPLRLPRWPN